MCLFVSVCLRGAGGGVGVVTICIATCLLLLHLAPARTLGICVFVRLLCIYCLDTGVAFQLHVTLSSLPLCASVFYFVPCQGNFFR